MARRRRGLSEEDRALWQSVAKTARPIHADGSKAADCQQAEHDSLHNLQNFPSGATSEPFGAGVPSRTEAAAGRSDHPKLKPFRLGEAADPRRRHDLSLPIAERLRQAPTNMDRRSFDRLVRGKLAPEARIDLHGMTLAEAHPALIGFILAASGRGLRLVLVITGKGKPAPDHGPIPTRSGALRHQVPEWLRMAPMGPIILQMTPAHQKHGGSGAYYVYLRRRR